MVNKISSLLKLKWFHLFVRLQMLQSVTFTKYIEREQVRRFEMLILRELWVHVKA